MYKLKQRKSSLKLLVAVGGWTAASEAFNNVIHNETSRAKFIRQTKEFLYDWNFDGIDLVSIQLITDDRENGVRTIGLGISR
jgi:chitinase